MSIKKLQAEIEKHKNEAINSLDNYLTNLATSSIVQNGRRKNAEQ